MTAERRGNGSAVPTIGRLTARLVGFLVVAAPLAFYIWRVLSDVLTGRIHWPSIGLATALLAIFLGIAFAFGRHLKRLAAGGPS